MTSLCQDGKLLKRKQADNIKDKKKIIFLYTYMHIHTYTHIFHVSA